MILILILIKMDDIERICLEINAENANEQIGANVRQIPSSEVEIRNSSGSFVVLEDDSEISLESSDDINARNSFDEIQLPMNYSTANTLTNDSLIIRPNIGNDSTGQDLSTDLSTDLSSVATISNTNQSNLQPTPILPAPPIPISKNKERFGQLTGIVIANGISGIDEEIGIGKRTELYITNHDPGNRRQLPATYSNIQTFYDVLTCSMPFKYGMGLVIAKIIINLLFLALAIINYDSCENSSFPLTLYIICRTSLGLIFSVLDIIIYYFDACWNSIIICNRKLTFTNTHNGYTYADLFGFIISIVTPIIDTVVGIIFLIIFQDMCHPLIWVICLVYIIICCPVRRITMR